MRDKGPGEKRPAMVDPWLRRNVHYPGSAPEYAESPIARFWAKAADSRADAAEKIAHLREVRREAKEGSAGHHWPLRRRADS
jgi:hypothetical protein